MARNAIESDFRTSKMAADGHFVKKTTEEVSYGSEMARNVIESEFRTFKMAAGENKKVPYRSERTRNAIESEFRTYKMADRSEMARNAIESDFRTSKMVAGGHCVKKIRIDLKWPEMRSKVIFGHPKKISISI